MTTTKGPVTTRPDEASPHDPSRPRVVIMQSSDRLAAEAARDAACFALPGWGVRAVANTVAGDDTPGVGGPPSRSGAMFEDTAPGSIVALWKPDGDLIATLAARPFRYRLVVVCPDPVPQSWSQSVSALGPIAAVTADDGIETFITALQSAAGGRAYCSPLAEARFRTVRDRVVAATPEAGPMLTTRQEEVLRMFALGYSIRETAEALALTERTVESHRYRVCKRLGVHDRSELVRIAIREGLVAA